MADAVSILSSDWLPRVRYEYVGHVGDQDWLTVLGWDKPHLFHLLGCEYNLQVS